MRTLGWERLATELHSDKTHEEVAKFAKELHRRAERGMRDHFGMDQKAVSKAVEAWHCSARLSAGVPSFEVAMRAILQLSRWCEVVGALGFSFEAR